MECEVCAKDAQYARILCAEHFHGDRGPDVRSCDQCRDELAAEAKDAMAVTARKFHRTRRMYASQIRQLSNGRAHHQGWPVGGLHAGLPADLSGAPCWCGIRTADLQ